MIYLEEEHRRLAQTTVYPASQLDSPKVPFFCTDIWLCILTQLLSEHVWSIHGLILPYLTAYKVWFSFTKYPNSPCYTIKETTVSHARCDASHLACQMLVRFRSGGGRGTYRTERISVHSLYPKFPKTKGLALVIHGPRRGTLTIVKRQVRTRGRATGFTVLLEDSGEEWDEPLDNLTKVEHFDTPD